MSNTGRNVFVAIVAVIIIFLMWSFAEAQNFTTITIDDSAYVTVTYTSAIDSAQIRVTNYGELDTLSAMPIIGASHTTVVWADSVDMFSAPGTFLATVYTYSSGAINDSIFGVIKVELEEPNVNVVTIAGNAEDADSLYAQVQNLDGWAPMNGTDSLFLALVKIYNTT